MVGIDLVSLFYYIIDVSRRLQIPAEMGVIWSSNDTLLLSLYLPRSDISIIIIIFIIILITTRVHHPPSNQFYTQSNNTSTKSEDQL